MIADVATAFGGLHAGNFAPEETPRDLLIVAQLGDYRAHKIEIPRGNTFMRRRLTRGTDIRLGAEIWKGFG